MLGYICKACLVKKASQVKRVSLVHKKDRHKIERKWCIDNMTLETKKITVFKKLTRRTAHLCPAKTDYVEFIYKDIPTIGKIISFNKMGDLHVSTGFGMFSIKNDNYREVKARAYLLKNGRTVYQEKLTKEVRLERKRLELEEQERKLRSKIGRSVLTTNDSTMSRAMYNLAKEQGIIAEIKDPRIIVKKRSKIKSIGLREEADDISYEYEIMRWINSQKKEGHKVIMVGYGDWNFLKDYSKKATSFEHKKISGHVFMRMVDFFILIMCEDFKTFHIDIDREDNKLYKVSFPSLTSEEVDNTTKQ